MSLLLINLKTYPLSLQKGLQIIHACEEQTRRSVTIGLAVPALDLEWYTQTTKLPIYAQHIDLYESGAHTGSVLACDVKLLGGKGSLLNHSEKRVDTTVIAGTIKQAQACTLPLVVCAENSHEVRHFSQLKPNYIAIEPRELIGGKISVSTAQPGLIKKSVLAAAGVPLLVGAGVHTAEDVRVGLELGAYGVLVASGVVLAPKPGKVIGELVKGFS